MLKEENKNSSSCCSPSCCAPEQEHSIESNAELLKNSVKEKYREIALGNVTSCCGTVLENGEISDMSEDASQLGGYNADADLNLGCGLPTELAHIQLGDTVVDLGSGAGNDCFIARDEVGAAGRVIGIDFTEEMNTKARKNNEKLGYKNVEFLQGDIEAIPLEDSIADVVVSNCVMNLVPDKDKAYAETFRILKPGGHFSISDIVIEGSVPTELVQIAELYAGCVSGATEINSYVNTVYEAGFEKVKIQKKRLIEIPKEELEKHFSGDLLEKALNSIKAIYSINIFGQKPA